MAKGTRTIQIAGAPIEVEDMDIVRSAESFNEYDLADGTKVRVKSVLTALMKVVGASNPDGTPLYLVNVSPVLIAVRPTQEKS